MQLSMYNTKDWHALSPSLHFVRHEGLLATHSPSPASKSGSRLPIFNSVCLGLVPVQIDSPYLIIMSWITISRDEYYIFLTCYFWRFFVCFVISYASIGSFCSIIYINFCLITVKGFFITTCHGNKTNKRVNNHYWAEQLYRFWQKCRSDEIKLSNVRRFIIVWSVGGLVPVYMEVGYPRLVR